MNPSHVAYVMFAMNLWLALCLLGARYLTRRLERENRNLQARLDCALRGMSR